MQEGPSIQYVKIELGFNSISYIEHFVLENEVLGLAKENRWSRLSLGASDINLFKKLRCVYISDLY